MRRWLGIAMLAAAGCIAPAPAPDPGPAPGPGPAPDARSPNPDPGTGTGTGTGEPGDRAAGPGTGGWATDTRTLEQLLAAAPADFDAGRAAALLAAEDDPRLRPHAVTEILDALAAAIRSRLPAHPRPVEAIRAARDVLYTDAGLHADPNDPDGSNPDNLYIHRVLARRKGYCVSLATIWLAVGGRLGWPLRAVRLPGHFFVRWDDGRTRINIETTDFGARRDDAYYAEKYRVHPIARRRGVYLASLEPRAVVAELLNNQAVLASTRGDPARGLRLLDRALAVTADHPYVLYNRGVIRSEQGDTAGARADFDAVVALDPNNTYALVNRADLRRRAGDDAGAASDLARAAAADPTYAGAAIARALFALDQGRLDAAGRAIDRALAQNRRDARAWVAKARLLRLRRDPTAALLAANQALVYARRDAEALAERALAYAAMGNHRRALESWNGAVAAAPKRVDIRRNRAVTRAATGDLEGAREDLVAVIRLKPRWAPGYEALGKVLLKLGRRQEALPHLRTCLQLAPDSAGAAEIRALIAQLGG